MANGLASITIIGTLGRDAEQRRTPNGAAVLEFSVAVNTWAKSGEATAWYRCSMFGQRGEKLANMLRKGQTVGVAGTLNPREYRGKDGQAKTSLDVHVSEVTLLGGKRRDTAPAESDYDDGGAAEAEAEVYHAASDLPF